MWMPKFIYFYGNLIRLPFCCEHASNILVFLFNIYYKIVNEKQMDKISGIFLMLDILHIEEMK